MKRDSIYAAGRDNTGPFEFNEAVVEVFPDMIRRSVPGYARTLAEIERLAARIVVAGTNCYDLGCSLGAATLAMRRGIRCDGARIVAVDNSTAMVERCRWLIAEDACGTPVEVRLEDMRDTRIEAASLVIMNYALQFIPPADRAGLLGRIRSGMRDGGVLVLSEKVCFADPALNDLFIELHHDFKRANAYSDLEISRKRAALEEVLIPDTTELHGARLKEAGFRHAGVWMQELNFASFVAIA